MWPLMSSPRSMTWLIDWLSMYCLVWSGAWSRADELPPGVWLDWLIDRLCLVWSGAWSRPWWAPPRSMTSSRPSSSPGRTSTWSQWDSYRNRSIEEESDRKEGKGRRCWLGPELKNSMPHQRCSTRIISRKRWIEEWTLGWMKVSENGWSSGSHHTKPPPSQNGCSSNKISSNHPSCMLNGECGIQVHP